MYKGAQVSPSYEHVAFIHKKRGICQQLKGYAVICSCIYKRSGAMSAIKNYTVATVLKMCRRLAISPATSGWAPSTILSKIKIEVIKIFTFFSFSVIISFRVRKQQITLDLFEHSFWTSVTYDRKTLCWSRILIRSHPEIGMY